MRKDIFMPNPKPQRISCALRIRASESRDQSDLGGVYIQVVIDRIADRIPLAISWPIKKFDQVGERLIPRFPDDQECYDNNLIIADQLGVANDIRTFFRLNHRKATSREFKKLFNNPNARTHFIDYCKKNIEERKRSGRSKKQSIKNYFTFLERVKDYQIANHSEELLFSDLDGDFLYKFNDYWKKQGKAANTRTGWVKHFKSFARNARKDKIYIDDEFFGFSRTYKEGKTIALDQAELRKITKYCFTESNLTAVELEVLKKFVFSCYTGLRISDSNQLHQRHLNRGVLNISLLKGEHFDRVVTMDLPEPAKMILKGRNSLIFKKMFDSQVNKTLKVIFKKLEIDVYVTFHVARHTFATIYLELADGNLNEDMLSLKDLLGHGSLKQVEKYLRSREKNKKAGMMRFDRFLDEVQSLRR